MSKREWNDSTVIEMDLKKNEKRKKKPVKLGTSSDAESDTNDDEESDYEEKPLFRVGSSDDKLDYDYLFEQENEEQVKLERNRIYSDICRERIDLKRRLEELGDKEEEVRKRYNSYKKRYQMSNIKNDKLKGRIKISKTEIKVLKNTIEKKEKGVEKFLKRHQEESDKMVDSLKSTYEKIIKMKENEVRISLEEREKQMQKDVSEREKRVRSTESKLIKKTKSLDDLRMEYDRKIEEFKDLKRRLKIRDKTIVEKIDFIKRKDDEIEKMKVENGNLSRDVERLSSKDSKRDVQMKRLREKYEFSSSACDKLQIIGEDMTTKKLRLEKKVRRLSLGRGEVDNRLAKVIAKNDQLTMKMGDIGKLNNALTESLREMKVTIIKKDEMISKLELGICRFKREDEIKNDEIKRLKQKCMYKSNVKGDIISNLKIELKNVKKQLSTTKRDLSNKRKLLDKTTSENKVFNQETEKLKKKLSLKKRK